MKIFCTAIVIVFGITYLLCLGLYVIGSFGLFGSPSGPLAGVFLMPLGLPWVFMLERFSDTLKPWLAILAPGLNLIILATVCRILDR